VRDSLNVSYFAERSNSLSPMLFHQKEYFILLDALAASDFICLFARMCFSISFLPVLLMCTQCTYPFPYSTFITNQKRIFESKNAWKWHILLRGTPNLKFKTLLIILNTTKRFTLRLCYYLFTTKEHITTHEQVHAHFTRFYSVPLSVRIWRSD
jgi:hypothetical protein